MTISYSIVPHTHWDYEWYFSQNKQLLYLFHDLDQIIDVLEKNEKITYFILDAQTSVLDDYLKYRKENEERIKKLIKEKRLLTGPWFTQTDQMIVHGEAIVRNLYYGTTRAEELGHCMHIGYCVDCFGNGAQMPQIYKGFNIPYLILRRGIVTHEIPNTEFIWESDDGSQIYAYRCLDYANFRNPSLDTEETYKLIKEIEAKEGSRSLSGKVLLFNGFDTYPIRQDIDKILENLQKDTDLQVNMDHFEKVVEDIFKKNDLQVYRGEFTLGQEARCHKSIYSSRSDIKSIYSQCENHLIHCVEPLQAIYYYLTGKEEKGYIQSLWKLLMESAAHDSMGGCNNDETNGFIKNRLLNVLNSLNEYERLTYRKIAKAIDSKEYSMQVYNYLPYRRKDLVHHTVVIPYTDFKLKNTKGEYFDVDVLEIKESTDSIKGVYNFIKGTNGDYRDKYLEDTLYYVEFESLVEVDGLGYETFFIEPVANEKYSSLENDLLKVTISDNGTLNVFDKTINKEYKEMLVFEENVDAGDSYNYSTWSDDRVYSSKNAKITNLKIEHNRASYEIEMQIPYDMEERKAGICSKTMIICVDLKLLPHKSQINFHICVKNPSTEHRVRALFKTDIPSEYSYADQSFGLIRRPTKLDEQLKVWQEKHWEEKPVTIEPMKSLVYLKDDKQHVMVVTNSVREYQIVGDDLDTIAYTLFRSYPKMGKSDLETRPGRASGIEGWPTPDASLIGDFHTNFSLCFNTNESLLMDMANEYLTPLRGHQESEIEASLSQFPLCVDEKNFPESLNLVQLKSDSAKMSIFKLGEKDGYILRSWQLTDGTLEVEGLSNTKECLLNEEEIDVLQPKTYKKNKIVTIKGEIK